MQYTEAQVVERQESMLHRQQIETFIETLNYQASSADEKALVEACAKLGIIFLNDNNEIYTLRLRMTRKQDIEFMQDPSSENNDIVQYKRLQVVRVKLKVIVRKNLLFFLHLA